MHIFCDNLSRNSCIRVGLKRPLDEKETINMAILFLFVWRLQSWLAMKITAVKSKLYNFPLLHSLTSSLCYDACTCFIGRNLDSRTTMLKDHASQWTYISQITTVFHEFFPIHALFSGQFTFHAKPLPDPEGRTSYSTRKRNPTVMFLRGPLTPKRIR